MPEGTAPNCKEALATLGMSAANIQFNFWNKSCCFPQRRIVRRDIAHLHRKGIKEHKNKTVQLEDDQFQESKDPAATHQPHSVAQSTAERLSWLRESMLSITLLTTFLGGRLEKCLDGSPPCTPWGVIFSFPLTPHPSAQSSLCYPVQKNTHNQTHKLAKPFPFSKPSRFWAVNAAGSISHNYFF